jgi:tape measure domain-containing protein
MILFKMSETLAKSMAVAGTPAAQTGELIRQIGQAMASDFKGVAQEINSLLDQNTYLANAIAKELGLESGAALKKFAEDGKLNLDNFAGALDRVSKKVDDDFAAMPQTVEKAMVKLDNAFLNYFGRSDLVASGTSSIAAGITGLANNFDTLATAGGIAAGVIVGRLIPSLNLSLVGYINNTKQSILYQSQLARLAVASSVAATSQQTLALSSTNAATRINALTGVTVASTSAMQGLAIKSALAGRAMWAAFGGPIGLAITGLTIGFTLLGDETDTATQFQEENNIQIAKAKELYDKINKATGDRADVLRQEREAQLDLVQAKLLDAKATFEQAKAQAMQIDKAAKNGFTSTGGEARRTAAFDATLEAEKSYVALITQYQDLINIKKTGKTVTEQTIEAEAKLNSEIDKGVDKVNKKTKAIKDNTEQLYKTTLENERAAEQADMLAYANEKGTDAYEID